MPLQSLASRLRHLDFEIAQRVHQLRNGHDPAPIAEALDSVRNEMSIIANELMHNASSLSGVDGVIADAMNNVLMSIQTVCDRLRDRTVSSGAIREVHDQLRDTIESGRSLVTRIRQVIGKMA